MYAGLFTWYDLYTTDGYIPEPNSISINTSKRALFNTTKHWSDDPEENWESLQTTLSICDEVTPHVSEWIRKLHSEGKIIWQDRACDGERAIMAAHNVDGHLTINEEMFLQNDGKKVSYLAHEWRHSRQNMGKVCKFVLSYIFFVKDRERILENDAYLYENKVYLAIFDVFVLQSRH